MRLFGALELALVASNAGPGRTLDIRTFGRMLLREFRFDRVLLSE